MPKRRYNDDDGRVIADMSGVERQPLFGQIPKKREPVEKNTASDQARQPIPVENELSVWKTTLLVWRIVLPIVFAVVAALALFILFCQFVWLK